MLARLLWILIAAQALLAASIAWWLTDGAGWPVSAAIVAGLAVPLLLHALVLAVHFAVAARHASPPPAGFTRGAALAWRLYRSELRTSVSNFDWRMPLFGGYPLASARPPGRAQRLPVLFVHGMVCNRAIWRPFARYLARQGHVTGSVNLEPVFGSIDSYADVIAEGIRELQRRTGDEQVAMVCHSMGGLAARAYLRRHGIDAIARVVTIATPHRGTCHASLLPGSNLAQMRRDSPWLADLAASEDSPTRRLFTVYVNHHDNIVVPQAIQTLPDAEIVDVAELGHVSILYAPRIWKSVAERLRQ